MFRCPVSGKVSKPHETGIWVVVKRREKVYNTLDREGRSHQSVGWEIVEEVYMSHEGYAEFQKREMAK